MVSRRAWPAVLAACVVVFLSASAPASAGFASPVTLGPFLGPRAVAIADLNEDGRLDLVVANSEPSIQILLGDESGTFGGRASYGVGADPWSIAVGDLNGDGHPDIAVANRSAASVSILLGAGNGSFSSATGYAAGYAPQTVAIGDLNEDGDADLAVTAYDSQSISVLLGNGNGTFGAATSHSAHEYPSSVAIADIDGDGHLDLVVPNSISNDVSVLFGAGDGTFGTAVNHAVGTAPISLAVGDLNADGHPDLAAANSSSDDVSILLGNGTGGFAPAVDYDVHTTPYSVAIGDLDGDGAPDLAVANVNSDDVSVLLGNGNGTFAARTDYDVGSGPWAVAIGDLDGDGVPDIVDTNAFSGSYLVPSTISILYGDWTPPVITRHVSPAPNAAGWNKADVTVTWDVSDPESSVSTTGCGETEISGETAGTAVTCEATSTGGTSSDTVTVKLDRTAPHYPTSHPSPAGNAAGWWNQDVTITYTANGDSGVVQSGVVGCTDSNSVTLETTGWFVVGTCTDAAGNTSADNVGVTVRLDKTAPPAPTAHVSPAPNVDGWNRTNVTVGYTGNGDAGDVQSGLDSCTGDQLVTSNWSGTLQGTCVDVAGNVSVGLTTTVKLDKTPPAAPTAHVSPAPNGAGWNNSNVTVSFTANGDTGGSGILSCTTEQLISTPTSGTVVSGTCTDVAGNTSAAASVTVKLDKTAPDTAIGSGPANPTNTTVATFTFSSEAGASLQCRLDGGSWAACTSPKTYTGLAKRSHLFEARASDVADNADPTPAKYAWTNGKKPKPTITEAPLALVNTGAARFSFTSTDPGASYQCAVDGGAFSACTSPKTYTGLGQGKHTFSLKAIDAAGRAGAAARSWGIDFTIPETTITKGPPATTGSTKASFSYKSTERGSTFECSLDGAPFVPCKSSIAYKGLAAGAHTFQVKATDPAGNPETVAASWSWTITA